MKTIFGIALLATLIVLPAVSAIGVGAWAQSKLTAELVSQTVAARCDERATNDLSDKCATLASAEELQVFGAILLGAMIALPLILSAMIRHIGKERETLTRYFFWLFRFATYALVAVILLEAGVVWFTAIVAGRADLPLSLVIFWFVLFGLALLVVAVIVLRHSHRLLLPQPLSVTAVAVQEAEAPELWARVRRLANSLRAEPPSRILIGLDPRVFVTMGPVALYPSADMVSGESLYLSAVLLHVLPDEELDALIAHELGHFRGQDLAYTQRFIPGFRSLLHALSSVNTEEPRHSLNPLQGWISLGRLPARLLLLWLAGRVALSQLHIGREREFEADRAAIEVAPPRALILAIVKVALLQPLWPECQRTVVNMVREEKPRFNLVFFFRQFAKAYWSKGDHAANLQLRIARVAAGHPTDTHPPLCERAAAIGASLEGVVAEGIAAYAHPLSVPQWAVGVENRLSYLVFDAASTRSWVKEFIVARDSEQQKTLG